MRPLACSLAALALVSLANAESRLRIVQGSQPVGWVTISQRLTPTGGKVVELRTQTGTAANMVRTHRQSIYGPDGRLTRIFQETTQGNRRLPLIVTFDDTGATVVNVELGLRKVRQIPWPADAKRPRASEFWFVRDQPTPKTECEFTDLDLNTFAWKTLRVQYIGPETVSVKGAAATLSKLISQSGERITTTWVDAMGLPVRMEDQSGLRFER